MKKKYIQPTTESCAGIELDTILAGSQNDEGNAKSMSFEDAYVGPNSTESEEDEDLWDTR
ncbi:MAG: hypothetical protein ACOYJG_11235 [Prevotella sp.]|jgi:hypothetical protein